MKNTLDMNRSQRLFIELGTPLLLESMEPGRSVSGELVGMRVGSYLIVQVSDMVWATNPDDCNAVLKVKYICSGDVFGFTTRILHTTEQPDRLVFLEYPLEVESCNVRSRLRVDCFLPVRIDLEKKRTTGVVLNINQDGCLCHMDMNGVSESDVRSITFLSLGFEYANNDTLAIRGQVMSLRPENRRLRLGIRFDPLDSFAKTVLTTLVPALNL
ncbi:MAG: PilZ domain-containing protein [Pseudomonadota bacterium]